jgi:hypothetical protein
VDFLSSSAPHLDLAVSPRAIAEALRLSGAATGTVGLPRFPHMTAFENIASGEPAVRAAALLARAGLADRELDDRARARRR